MNHKHGADENSGTRDRLTREPDAQHGDAVVGGLAGKGMTEAIDLTREDSYWRDNYSKRPYVERGATYEDYGPAYGFGVDAVTRYPGRAFDDIEPEMSHAWTTGGGVSLLGWSNAKHAARDAWNRAMGHGNPNG